MLIGGNEETKKIDDFSINTLGIPSIVLMENAAVSFMKHIDLTFSNYLVICGKGNNGGDGYAIARHLNTAGKTVIMGRKTFESIGKPLPNRRNIVVSRTLKKKAGEKKLEIEIYNDFGKIIKDFQNLKEEVFIIGGEEIYKSALNYADRLYISYIE